MRRLGDFAESEAKGSTPKGAGPLFCLASTIALSMKDRVMRYLRRLISDTIRPKDSTSNCLDWQDSRFAVPHTLKR